MDGEDFARVLLPGCDGEVGHVYVEELYGAVAARGEELGLVRFGPGAVEEGVLRVEPVGEGGLACDSKVEDGRGVVEVPFLGYDAIRCKT